MMICGDDMKILIMRVFVLVYIVVSRFLVSEAFAKDKLSWDKTFPQSKLVRVKKVSFYNRLGINIVADMYLPRNMKNKKSPAIIVGAPFGGVKEQTAGLYAQKMAEKGYIALAFDASYNGESGGQPRAIASPEAFVEDFSAAVDFLGTRSFVDRNLIGVIGLCGSGGFAISAAQIDPRMKAIVTVSMYDMGRVRRQELGDSMTLAERKKRLEEIAQQRYIEFLGGEKTYVIGTPEHIDKNSSDAEKEFYEYYRTKRGYHPRSTTAMSRTSDPALMNFFPFAQIETISPRPILFIVGEHANSRYFSEDAYALAQEPKELFIVSGAGHVDLYDNMQYIPFEKIDMFFKSYLK